MMQWYGYGNVNQYHKSRFDVSIDRMTESYIEGDLLVTCLYETVHETHFEGAGILVEGAIVYTLRFETPAVIGSSSREISEMEMIYIEACDQFIFDGSSVYKVTMDRISDIPSESLAKNESWSGYGYNRFCNHFTGGDHVFKLDVYEQHTDKIEGKLTVLYNGNVEHETEFTGRGYTLYRRNIYEILLKTPRTGYYQTTYEESLIERTFDRFWLIYFQETETFVPSVECPYNFELEKEE